MMKNSRSFFDYSLYPMNVSIPIVLEALSHVTPILKAFAISRSLK